MAILHEILVSNEAAIDDTPAPKTSEAAIIALDAYYPEFAVRAEKVQGRLYAMVKKLTGEGSVNADIKYLKTRYLSNPSQLVTTVSQNLTTAILFNEKLFAYDEKMLNHPVAKRVCEEHIHAIDQLLEMKKALDIILAKRKSDAASDNDTAERDIKNTNRNFQTLSRSILWSARRLLANVRLK